MPPPVIDFRYAPTSVWTCICRPDDDYKTIVRQDGSLLYGRGRIFTFFPQYAHLQPRILQRTESPESGIVITRLDYGFVGLTLTAFGHQHDGKRRTDVVLWQLTADVGAPILWGAVGVRLGESDATVNNRRITATTHDLPRVVLAADSVIPPVSPAYQPATTLRSVPQTLVRNEDYQELGPLCVATEAVPLAPGETIRGAFLVPQNHDEVAALDFAWAEQALVAERAFWKSYPLCSRTLQVPDPAIQDMLTASARNILQSRVIKQGLPFFHVGPLACRGLWVVDGHFITEAARYLGHDDAADLAWHALLSFRRDNGAIAALPFHTKETGVALTTLVRHSELTGNWQRLEQHWGAVRAAVDYIAQLRAEAMTLDPSQPSHGLMPDAYADGGISGIRPEYTTSLWTAAGLKHIARAARIIGQVADADRFQKMAEQLRDRLMEHMARHRIVPADGGTPFVPMAMLPDQHNFGHLHTTPTTGTPSPWTAMTPLTGTWAFCHAIYPGEVFPPDAPFVRELLVLLDACDDDEGIPTGTGWNTCFALWTYYASFAGHAWLSAGRSDKAVAYLYAFANHAAPTRAWREEQSLRSHPQARATGDMPHNWAGAEFVRLVRHLLVFETCDELHWLRGLPDFWIVPGSPVVVEQTPTRFGPVSLRLEAASEREFRVRVERNLSWRLQPAKSILWLPEGTTQVRVDGAFIPQVNPRIFELPPVASLEIHVFLKP